MSKYAEYCFVQIETRMILAQFILLLIYTPVLQIRSGKHDILKNQHFSHNKIRIKLFKNQLCLMFYGRLMTMKITVRM